MSGVSKRKKDAIEITVNKKEAREHASFLKAILS